MIQYAYLITCIHCAVRHHTRVIPLFHPSYSTPLNPGNHDCILYFYFSYFSHGRAKISDQNNARQEGCIWAFGSEGYSPSWWGRRGGKLVRCVAHIVFSARKQRKVDAGTQLTLSGAPSPRDDDTHIQVGSFFGDADYFLLNLPPEQDLSLITPSASARITGSSSRSG